MTKGFFKIIGVLLVLAALSFGVAIRLSQGSGIVISWEHAPLVLSCMSGDAGYNGEIWQSGGKVIVHYQEFNRGENGVMICTNNDGSSYSYPVKWSENTVTVSNWCPDNQDWKATFIYHYFLYLADQYYPIEGDISSNNISLPSNATKFAVQTVMYVEPSFWAPYPPPRSNLITYDFTAPIKPGKPSGLKLKTQIN